jgi:hypothetical protein
MSLSTPIQPRICDVVEHIYVISMPESDRRDGIIEMCDKLRKPYEFYWRYYVDNDPTSFRCGITGKRIPFGKNILHPPSFFKNPYNRRCTSLTRHHVDIYRKIAESGKIGMVLEDDSRIYDESVWTLPAPLSFHAISLTKGLSKNQTNGYDQDFKIKNFTNTADCIIVTPEYCRLFLIFFESGITEIRFDHLSNIFLRKTPAIRFFHSNKYFT